MGKQVTPAERIAILEKSHEGIRDLNQQNLTLATTTLQAESKLVQLATSCAALIAKYEDGSVTEADKEAFAEQVKKALT